jgi:hypothetical protein
MVWACQTEKRNKQNQSNHGLATRKKRPRVKPKKTLDRWDKTRFREAGNYELILKIY